MGFLRSCTFNGDIKKHQARLGTASTALTELREKFCAGGPAGPGLSAPGPGGRHPAAAGAAAGSGGALEGEAGAGQW